MEKDDSRSSYTSENDSLGLSDASPVVLKNRNLFVEEENAINREIIHSIKVMFSIKHDNVSSNSESHENTLINKCQDDFSNEALGIEDFNFIFNIGKGGFGRVDLYEKKVTNDKFAIKIVNIPAMVFSLLRLKSMQVSLLKTRLLYLMR